MKRRDFFRSLVVAPAAVVAAAIPSTPKPGTLVAVGVAGETIPKGETIYHMYTVEDPNWYGWSIDEYGKVNKHGPGWSKP